MKIFYFKTEKESSLRSFKNIKNGGFSLLESIVAIMVLSLAISGAFAAVQQGLSQSNIAKDEIKAFYLAQEAVEIIRNKRDHNKLANVNWLSGITNNCPFGSVCSAEAFGIGGEPELKVCAGWGTCSLIDNFSREIMIEDSINPDEITITVRVSWSKGSINKNVEFKTFMHNWK